MQTTDYPLLALYQRSVDRRSYSVCGHARVDAADVAWLRIWGWLLDSKGYACRYTPHSEGHEKIMMHRALLGMTDPSVHVDHINRDTLDNRRQNLRIGDAQLNARNRGSYRASTSPFRAVWWDRERRRWCARVRLDGIARRLGYFDTELEAAEAVEAWRVAENPAGWERDPLLPT